MGIIVTDEGFRDDNLAAAEANGEFRFLTPDELAEHAAGQGAVGLTVDNSTDLEALVEWFDAVDVIVIPFPSFADGRGFSIARRLRQLGYGGKLRASGHLIADQYAHARRVGIDEIAISNEIAARQPEDQWTARAGWQQHFYQKRLLGTR